MIKMIKWESDDMMKVVKKKVVTPVIIVCWCWYLHSFFKHQFLTPGPINLLAKKKMLEPAAKASECVIPSLSEIYHLLFFWSVSNVKNTVCIFLVSLVSLGEFLKWRDPQNHRQAPGSNLSAGCARHTQSHAPWQWFQTSLVATCQNFQNDHRIPGVVRYYVYHCIPNSHGWLSPFPVEIAVMGIYMDILIWLDKAMPGRPKIHNSQVQKLEILRQIRYVWATSNHGTFIILLHDAALFIDNKNTNVFLSNRDKILHVLYCINFGGSITVQPPKSDWNCQITEI